MNGKVLEEVGRGVFHRSVWLLTRRNRAAGKCGRVTLHIVKSLHGAKFSWEANGYFFRKARNSPHFMGPEGSLPLSQQHANDLYPQPDPVPLISVSNLSFMQF
jgi:hypothetical protein